MKTTKIDFGTRVMIDEGNYTSIRLMNFWSEKYSLQTGIFLDFIIKLDVTIMIEWEENNMNFIKIDRVGIRINTIQILFVNFEVKHA